MRTESHPKIVHRDSPMGGGGCADKGIRASDELPEDTLDVLSFEESEDHNTLRTAETLHEAFSKRLRPALGVGNVQDDCRRPAGLVRLEDFESTGPECLFEACNERLFRNRPIVFPAFTQYINHGTHSGGVVRLVGPKKSER